MESNWVKVREMVAERVLTRHLDDLEQQKQAVEMARMQHARDVDGLDMRSGQRLRAASLHVEASGPRIAATRRRSLPSGPERPLSPPSHATRSPRKGDLPGSPTLLRKRRSLAEGVPAAEEKPKGDRAGRRGVSFDGGREPASDLLQLMKSTLEEAQEVEERRPVLYLQPTLSPSRLMAKRDPGKRSRQQTELINVDNAPLLPAKHQPKDSIPSLQRGEAFIETGQSQVLSLEGDVAGDGTSANTSRRVSQAGTAGSAAEKDQDGKSDSPRETSTSEDPTEPRPTTRKSSSGRKEGNATVEFYDEEVGLTPKKDDGGFTPQSLSLPLEELADKNDDNDDEKGDAKDEDDVVDTGTPREDDVWNQVRKSRYIRGYDPPEMLMPAEPLSFVFNGKYTHSE